MINVAVIGAGNWGKNLVRNFNMLPGAHLEYICDLAQPTRDQMATLYPQATVTGDYEEALSDPGVQAVVVAVEERLHFPIAPFRRSPWTVGWKCSSRITSASSRTRSGLR